MESVAQDCCGGSSQTHDSKYDLTVIGAGSAGFSAAIKAAELGARVLLIGHGTIGGTCVNVGCVPSKALIRAAEVLHAGDAAKRFAGVEASTRLQDWSALVAQKDALVDALRKAKYLDLLGDYEGVDYRPGRAEVVVGGVNVDGRFVASDKIIVATGGSPWAPPIAGLDEIPYLDSTSALALPALPGSMMVIGAGYIGAELAQMFARAGVRISLLCRHRLLPEGEPEISEALTGYLRDEGITILDGVSYERFEAGADDVTLSYRQNGKSATLRADELLVTAGRRPNTEGLGLESLGVKLNDQGAVVVDELMRTTHPDIYAAGDVTGRDEFVYMAAYGARLAASNAIGGNSDRYDASAMPAVVFTDPQVATVGLTEAAARQQGLDVQTSVLPLSAVPRALAANDLRGLIKLVAEQDSGRLLGAHILAPEGADSIQTAVMAIRGGLTVGDLGDTIFPYLTTVEGLRLAAQTFSKDVSKLSCCA